MNEENIDINNVELGKLQQAIANIAEDSENQTGDALKNPLELMDNVDELVEDDNADFKKYVLKIDKKYKEIIDKMTIEEREQYFNDMLEFYVKNKSNIEKRFKFKESFIHILVVLITVIIGLPLIFAVTNKSIEMTVDNYKQTQTNFINLYKEKGGIKKKDLSKMKDLQLRKLK